MLRKDDDATFIPPHHDAPSPPRRRAAAPPIPAPHGAIVLAVLAFATLVVLVLSFWVAEHQVSGATGESRLALAGGVLASAVAALAVFAAMRRQARQIAATASHLAALEALHDASAAVSGRLGGDDGIGREALVQLCEATRDLLGADRSGILLLDAANRRLELLASGGDMPGDAPRFYDLDVLPACRGVLAGREVLFVEDTQAPPASSAGDAGDAVPVPTPNSRVVEFFRARSMVLIPLHVEGRCIGLMTLSGSAPRRFDDADRRLAPLMGAQAAVILANARLIARTRASADQARAALAAHKAMLEQRDALTNVLRAGSFEESVQRIVRLAPAAVGVDRAGIGLTTDREGELVMVAVSQTDNAGVIGRPQDVSALNSGRALRERRTLVVENAGVEGGVHPAFRAELPHASIVYAPLFAVDGDAAAVVAPAGRPIGLLIFIREQPGSFSAEQMELMRAFCVRAAGVIETARLLDRTRHDARAKTVLLRELNHRVKNNLAGIAALLTVGRPELAPDAERWLARATDRITAMARAHDLFTGNVPAVTLPDLLGRTIASMPLPPGVGIRTDVDAAAAGVRLDTSRAVTLAMVVNELCHNAVVHGLGPSGGTVDVAARVECARAGGNDGAGGAEGDDAGVIIEVRDAGGRGTCAGGRAPMMPDRIVCPTERSTNTAGRRTGVGLELVGGLVTRELRGRFALVTRTEGDGGTVARVTFRVPASDVEPPPPVPAETTRTMASLPMGVAQ